MRDVNTSWGCELCNFPIDGQQTLTMVWFDEKDGEPTEHNIHQQLGLN